MLTYVLPFITATLFAFKMYCKFTCGMCKCDTKMNNKVVIVTGSNTGIGFETAVDLARRGARVILACRDLEKGIEAQNNIIQATGNENVTFKQLDLSCFASIHAFVADILQTEEFIHVLINNAGTGKLDNSLTKNNLPIEVQVNHFGPFLLTMLLLPIIKSSAPSRIINVSSILHKCGKVDPETFHLPVRNWFDHMRVYSNTKLANMLFTLKLSRILRGSGVTVNSLHPGAVSTDMFRNRSVITRYILCLFMKTPYEGAQTSIYLAVAPELEYVSGKYYSDCCQVTPSQVALDMNLANRLWDLSDKITFNSITR